MRVIWKPNWYDLDMSMVLGDQGYFYLNKNQKSFSSGLACDEDYEIIAKVISIEHSELSDVVAIICRGFDYYIYYGEGKTLKVCSEENPGEILEGEIDQLQDWSFNIEFELIEDTGIRSIERRHSMERIEFKEYWNTRNIQQDLLLENLLKK